MIQTLNSVLDNACAAVGQLPRKGNGQWDRRDVERTLRAIDSALIQHGFLYPETGAVSLLADALIPFQMTPAQKPAFQAESHNRRRAQVIHQKFPGPFYLLDCDTASFIYLGVADRLNLPLHMVVIPSYNRKPGHTFIRWRQGSHTLDWETMDGRTPPEGYYHQHWKITKTQIAAKTALAELTPDQLLGFQHYLLAAQHERQNNDPQALRELSRALELYPQNLDARRQFAWIAATAPALPHRHQSEAITHASYVLKMLDDPDAHDTLAAAYASAGQFDLAIKSQQTALTHSQRSPQFKKDYTQRLRLYEQKTPYRRNP